MDLSAINVPTAYNLSSHQHSPQQSDHQHHHPHHHPIYTNNETTKPRSAFHRHQPTSMPSPPELMHDSEEDEEESTGSPIMTAMQLDVAQPSSTPYHSIRKSTPHRSPPAVKDAIQASAVDKSVVFQLDVRSHPFFPASTTSSAARMSSSPAASSSSHDQAPMCPECKLTNCCGMACTSRVICGESLLTALRKRVAQARSEQQPRRRQRLAIQNRPSFKRSTATSTRKSTHIDIPRVAASSRQHYHSSEEDDDADDDYTEVSAEDEQEKRLREIRRRPWIDHPDQSTPSSSSQSTSPTTTTPQQQPSPTQSNKDHSPQEQQPALRKRSPPAGRPSRVKGPCQACQESSDGCMRKAFNWPFPTSSVYNDKGRKFVYLCNKCGLRYNKSGGCVCRNCRWVFCKEEKRKAMQHIEQMIRSRPDGHVDPDEDIEGFVCTPKYWTCGRPWKVGWVLQNNAEEDEDLQDATD
ncbi:hypothetical protein O0I10_001210 [Lichtheimia ornata]|uniref:Uncharacterized protein n=1 Tax=Lichtheimia ornata TaxID=688661 RepID=A0AAD8DIG5_9FUNG|nr:uncharacterized protein O0I10_001210 [Lichtheimia ornata]KAJ8663033.1 hypothetical protein O0I10_001210 [Lichtheimia ornata]